MIIFNLDGTLADCEHRRHFVDTRKNRDFKYRISSCLSKSMPIDDGYYNEAGSRFCADYKSFYEACDKDDPIRSVVEILHSLFACEKDIHIWSGRCESVWDQTEEWLLDNIDMKYCCAFNPITHLKMRPLGDNTPDEILKERWLDEYLNSIPKLCLPVGECERDTFYRKNPIKFVFDSDPKSIAMWKRRGIFVFDCNQSREF